MVGMKSTIHFYLPSCCFLPIEPTLILMSAHYTHHRSLKILMTELEKSSGGIKK